MADADVVMQSPISRDTLDAADLLFLTKACTAKLNDDMYALLPLSGFVAKCTDACPGLDCNTSGYPHSPGPLYEDDEPFEELDEEAHAASGLARKLFTTRVSNNTWWRFEDGGASRLIRLQLDERKVCTALEARQARARPFIFALYDLHSLFTRHVGVYPRLSFTETEDGVFKHAFTTDGLKVDGQTHGAVDLLQCDVFKKLADSLLLRWTFRRWIAQRRADEAARLAASPCKRKHVDTF